MTRRLLLVLAASSAGLFASALDAERAAAQSSKEFSTLRFYPAVGLGNFIGVDGASVPKHLTTTYGGYFDFSAKTLTDDNPCSGLSAAQNARCESGAKSFVPYTGMLHLTGSVAIADKLDLSLDLPLGFTDGNALFYEVAPQPGISPSRNISLREGFAFGDARVRAKSQLAASSDESLLFSVAAFSTLPTGLITSHGDCRDEKQCAYVGERGIHAGAYAIGEARVHDFRFAANLGAAYRPSRRLLNNRVGSELQYGVAAEYSATPLVRITGEVAGAVNVIGGKDYPVEARGAVGFGDEFAVLAGGGAGLYGDVGSPSFRVFVGARYMPSIHDLDQDGFEDDVDACPSAVEDKDGYMDQDGCPESDNDNDGVPDEADKCANDPEDKDGFEDEDGCPELDNDGDGVQDGYDSCEGQKEDIDGDRDDDGCPDFDTDRDGLPDDSDKCPQEPEDRDGLADDDGCPEVDFDGDGLHDPEDACPDQMESWNGVLDQDGCPEDDGDDDSVPDETDVCPEEAETLNGKSDEDGCADGAAVVTYSKGVLRTAQALDFEGTKLSNEKALIDTLVAFVQRAHKRGALHVVLVTGASSTDAEARVGHIVSALVARTRRTVTSELQAGSPGEFRMELRP